ncbi:MAG: ATP-grasp domain-containing protein, partial [Bacteroidales bacterium]|nr:ATP-grasp domain-containing protein [Bacteroidales bacterium]
MSADVLLIGSMGGIADVVAENLRQHSLTVESVPFPQNTFKDEFGYRRALKGAVDKFLPSFIIPIGHPLALSRMKGELPDGVTAIVESEDKIRLLDSKVDSSSLVSSLGIPQPAFYNTADDIPSGADVIFKRDRSFGGSGVYRPRTREAVVNLMNHEKGGRFLIEEFIDGEDYSVDAIRWGGRFFTGCYKSLGNRGQGPSTDRVKVQCPVIESYARKILDAVHYNGICGMDFRISRD